jgi:hypothetical protein
MSNKRRQFNPLIPIDDEDYAKALIKAFRVDLLLSVTEVPEICAFIAKLASELKKNGFASQSHDTDLSRQVP